MKGSNTSSKKVSSSTTDISEKFIINLGEQMSMHEQSLKLLRSLVPAINKISETLTAMEERYDSKISSLEVNVSTVL